MLIPVSKLHKKYGARTAVSNLSFSVERGEVVGFLGPNGAGKSTTLRILAGFLAPTSGSVTIGGFDVERDPDAARAAIGYMPEGVPLYPEMRVAEYLGFRAELKGVARSSRRPAIYEAMERAIVLDVANVPIAKLSKGYRQRVGLADALVARPPILILDEPTAGLDPNQIREVRNVLKDLAQDRTVLLSTHILGEVEASCTRAIVIAEGKLVGQGRLEDLRSAKGTRVFDLEVRGSREALGACLSGLPKTVELLRSPPRDASTTADEMDASTFVTLRLGDDAAIEDVVAALVHGKLGVRSVTPARSSLEEVFATLTRTDAERAVASVPS